MSRPGRTPRVLVFGENVNDSKSIRELLLAANEELGEHQVVALARPMSLTKQAGSGAVAKWSRDLQSAVRGHEARGPIAGIVVHRDADGPDPDGTVAEQLRDQLKPLGAHPVVPVQMIEAWWFLFPDAVEAVRPKAWRDMMPRQARDVETIDGPKVELQRLGRARRVHEYSEGDGPSIAAHVRRMGRDPQGRSASYQRLGVLARQLSGRSA